MQIMRILSVLFYLILIGINFVGLNMGKNYYIFSSGKLRRKENTLFLETDNFKKPIPIEEIDQIFAFGELDFNTKLLVFLAQNGIVLHVFNYYGYYAGSFYPREKLLSGTLLIRQVEHYLDSRKRLELAKKFVEGAAHNIKRNLEKRNSRTQVEKIKNLSQRIEEIKTINELMSLEAHIRKTYYSVWETITGWEFKDRKFRPPDNPLNALISFANSLVYASIVREIYMTALNPTVSYLHEPFERRFSLALDVAEIFKPVLADRLIFRVINLGKLKLEHFDKSLQFSYLTEEGRKIFVAEYDDFLEKTIVHRALKRKVKYKSLIRLELYKIVKHLLGEKNYKPLKVWW